MRGYFLADEPALLEARREQVQPKQIDVIEGPKGDGVVALFARCSDFLHPGVAWPKDRRDATDMVHWPAQGRRELLAQPDEIQVFIPGAEIKLFQFEAVEARPARLAPFKRQNDEVIQPAAQAVDARRNVVVHVVREQNLEARAGHGGL